MKVRGNRNQYVNSLSAFFLSSCSANMCLHQILRSSKKEGCCYFHVLMLCHCHSESDTFYLCKSNTTNTKHLLMPTAQPWAPQASLSRASRTVPMYRQSSSPVQPDHAAWRFLVCLLFFFLVGSRKRARLMMLDAVLGRVWPFHPLRGSPFSAGCWLLAGSLPQVQVAVVFTHCF